jgi:putative Mn2+ efflux pump MntP
MKMPEDLLLGLGAALLGLIILIFSKQIAKFSVNLDKLVYKKVNSFQVEFRQVLFVLGGLVFIYLGLSSVYHHFFVK